MSLSLESIKKLPKVLLHDHLDGGVRPQTIIDLAKEQNILLPENNPENLAKWFYTESTANDLIRCLNSFDITASVMQTQVALDRIAYEMMADMADDNIAYVETRFCPHLHVKQGLTYNQIIDSVLVGLEHGRAEFGIEYGLILCGLYNFSDETNLEIAKTCDTYIGNGVVGFDFAGAETEFALIKQVKTLEFLNQNKIPLTVHAGEVTGIHPIINAIDAGVRRIGHGCLLYNSLNTELIENTLEQLVARNIHIEINILSNLGTGAIKDLASHPVKKFLDKGISVALNTDDRLMFNNTLSQEYKLLSDYYKMDLNYIKQMNLNAINASFASSAIKHQISHRIESF